MKLNVPCPSCGGKRRMVDGVPTVQVRQPTITVGSSLSIQLPHNGRWIINVRRDELSQVRNDILSTHSDFVLATLCGECQVWSRQVAYE